MMLVTKNIMKTIHMVDIATNNHLDLDFKRVSNFVNKRPNMFRCGEEIADVEEMFRKAMGE